MRPPENDRPLAVDFDSVRGRLAQLASEAFPEWVDHKAPTLGNVLLDLYAYVADVLGHYIAAQGREGRLATALQRDNVVAISAMLGYRPTGATAAQAKQVFELVRPQSSDVAVPAGFEVKTGGPKGVSFRLLQALAIEAGSISASGIVEASSVREEVFDAHGTVSFRVTLSADNYLDRSAVVTDADGHAWVEVESLVRSTGEDRHFSVAHAHNNRPVLCFGNGTAGRVPTGMLRVSYRTGGGPAANVAVNTLTEPTQPIYNADGQPVEFRTYNPGPAAGGQDHESVESIRQKAPLSCRVAGITVSREDFEINACRVPKVARALMLTSDQHKGIQENTGRLYIVPEGGGPMTEETGKEVLRMVTKQYPCPLTFRVMPQSALYLPVDIAADIELTDEAPSPGSVTDAIYGALTRAFAISVDGRPNRFVDFGYYCKGKGATHGEVAWSNVVSLINRVPYVRKVNKLTMNGSDGDVTLQVFDFPELGKVDITVGGEPV